MLIGAPVPWARAMTRSEAREELAAVILHLNDSLHEERIKSYDDIDNRKKIEALERLIKDVTKIRQLLERPLA